MMLLSSKSSLATPRLAGPLPSSRAARRSAHTVWASAEHVRQDDACMGRRGMLLGSAAIASGLILPGAHAAVGSAYDFTVQQYEAPISLDKFKGQNVNYPGLRKLLESYSSEGFGLIAFPCNQFGGQAPGTSEEERQYAYRKFGIEFPIMDKIDVNGEDAHPLYKFLRAKQPVSQPSSKVAGNTFGETGAVEWNYTKFLVDRNGVPVKRYKPAFDPLEFEDDVRLVLAGKEPRPSECFTHPGRKVCQLSYYGL